ncbi:hypothetical protein BDN72DRAFT_880001 [Pluteus cervinus]|uniref:Uncharacterized protein n=1 Tax=Pluteus cervinus TaxID=181527 RepID=A0ACD3AMH4_9AGAR|nr:hypothetical protein BDN72DRAFT_880001 [Pluteus cervinus]
MVCGQPGSTATTTMSNSPRLPPELERLIFIFALPSNTYEVPTNLLLVARRVQEWLVAFAFRVVVISKTFSVYKPSPGTRRLSVVSHLVRHLLISNVASDLVRQYIFLCPNVTHLAIWSGYHDQSVVEALGQLHLTHLSIDPCILDGIPSSIAGNLYKTVTHLDIAHALPILFNPALLLNFESLTHLALFAAFDLSALKFALDRCGNLEVLIWLSKAPRSTTAEGPQLQEKKPMTDPRVVSIQCGTIADWKAGARSGYDMWVLADDVVAGRVPQPGR